MTRRVGATLLLILLVASTAGAEETWTLSRCEEAALARSHRIEAARSREEAARAGVDEARAGRRPTLFTEWRYRYESEVAEIPVPGQEALSFGDEHTAEGRIAVELPLWTGGRLSAAQRARQARLDAARQNTAADSLSVLHRVRATFYGALGTRERARVAEVAVGRLARHLARVEDALAVGTASEEERVEALARLRAAEQELLAARSEAETAEWALGELLGRPHERIRPDGGLDRSLIDDTAPLDGAWKERPELQALLASRRGRLEEADAARREGWPQVHAELGMHVGRPGVDPVANDWMDWASAGVGLRWELFDAGEKDARRRRARAEARALEHDARAVERGLAGAFEDAGARLDSAAAQQEKALERVELEQRHLELVRGRYDEGMATQTEVLDAQDDLTAAEADLAAARARVRLAEVDLLYVASR